MLRKLSSKVIYFQYSTGTDPHFLTDGKHNAKLNITLGLKVRGLAHLKRTSVFLRTKEFVLKVKFTPMSFFNPHY